MGKSIRSKTGEDIGRLGRKRWTAEDAAHVLSAWKASGLSLAAFSRRHTLTAQRVAWWRDRLAKVNKSGPARKGAAAAAFSFVPAVLRDCGAGNRSAAVTIRMHGGMAVEVADPALVSPRWLSALIRRCEEPAP